MYNHLVAQPEPLPDLPESIRDLADQQARVRAMLDHWARQEASDEPNRYLHQSDTAEGLWGSRRKPDISPPLEDDVTVVMVILYAPGAAT